MSGIQRLDFIITPPHGRATKADARFIPNQQPKPLVLFIHGFKGFKEWGHFNVLADYFAQAGFIFVKLNLSHNGSTLTEDDVLDLEAFGRNNFSIELTDIRTTLGVFTGNQTPIPPADINPEKIFLIGHSRGGGISILAATHDDRIRAVSTWAAISNLDQRWSADTLANWKTTGVHYVENTRTKQMMPLYYQLFEDYQINKERFDIAAAVRRMSQPLLLIHGTADETLPVQMAYDLKAANPAAELEILEGADHSFGGRHPFTSSTLPEQAQVAAEKTIAFFKKQ